MTTGVSGEITTNWQDQYKTSHQLSLSRHMASHSQGNCQLTV